MWEIYSLLLNNIHFLKLLIMAHEENRKLLEVLANCAAECSHCAVACLNEYDVSKLTRCIKLDLDCAEICGLAISFVSRGSARAGHLLQACADICEACAAECEKHSHMEHCRRCADICKTCAEACQVGVAA